MQARKSLHVTAASKSQMGRWKGMDEDMSDDQVSTALPDPWCEINTFDDDNRLISNAPLAATCMPCHLLSIVASWSNHSWWPKTF